MTQWLPPAIATKLVNTQENARHAITRPSDLESTSQVLLTIGAILLLGLITSAIGRRTFLPRVTLLLLFGVVIGRDALNLIPPEISRRFELVANVALLMAGFLLGEKLSLMTTRQLVSPPAPYSGSQSALRC